MTVTNVQHSTPLSPPLENVYARFQHQDVGVQGAPTTIYLSFNLLISTEPTRQREMSLSSSCCCIQYVRIEPQLDFDKRLREIDPEFPWQRKPNLAFILFDDGQDTYDDLLLWNSFIKEVCEGLYPQYRVILFCSYGSPSSRPLEYKIGTSPTLAEAARISLWPGQSPIGLLLNWYVVSLTH